MHFMTTTGIILLVAYVAFVVGSLGYTIGFLLKKLTLTCNNNRYEENNQDIC